MLEFRGILPEFSRRHSSIMRFCSVVIAGVLFVASLRPAVAQDKSWTTGKKTLAFLRFDLAQAPGDPISKPDALKLISDVNKFFNANSRGKFQIDATIGPTLRLPKLRSTYAQNKASILEDAHEVARLGAYHLETFDLEVMATPRLGDSSFGEGEFGQKGLVLQGDFLWRTLAQELCSNLGISGSDVWQPSGDSIIGPGEAKAFKDPFDIMGDQKVSLEASTLNAPHKWQAGWLSDAEVPVATKSAHFRIMPHDTAPAGDTTSTKAVRIPLKKGGAYWLEYQSSADTPHAKDGILVYRTGDNAGPTQLLQMNPDLAKDEGFKAAPLLTGHVFNDPSLNLYVAPLQVAGDGSMEVAVNIGPFPNNQQPEVEIGANKWEVDVDQPLTMAGHATDPDGDDVVYWWEFGDGEWGGNSKKVTKAWKEPGIYTVKCHVADLKGGVATNEAEVTVKGDMPQEGDQTAEGGTQRGAPPADDR
jgi:hypothetical protein